MKRSRSPMKSLGALAILALIGAAPLATLGCQQEKSGLDEAVEEITDEAEDAKEEIEDEIDDRL